jgi:hypothetical protein
MKIGGAYGALVSASNQSFVVSASNNIVNLVVHLIERFQYQS